MKRLLRKVAIVLWILYIVIGILFLFSSPVVGIIFIVPAALSLIVILEGKKNHSPAASTEESREDPQPAVPVHSTRSVHCTKLSRNDALGADHYVVLDVETTGFSPENDHIIEVAAIKVLDGRVVGRYQSFVNPHRDIPARITRLTGITNNDVLTAPELTAVASDLADFMDQGIPVVGHNITFDLGFVSAAFESSEVDANIQYIDTLPLAREAFPEMKDHKLATLIKALGLMNRDQEHRAMSDVEATAKLFDACQATLGGKEASSVHFDLDVDVEDEEDEPDLGYELNQTGMAYEAKGDIENAILYYEKSVAAGFDGSHPYSRLGVLYRKQRKFQDEIRICDAAIKMLEGGPNCEKKVTDFQHRKTAALQKLEKESAVSK